MRHVRLISFEDEPTGNLGLVVKGCEGPEIFADMEGGLIAHDLVEHQNGIGVIGCPADELEAMGGLWQVRGRHGSLFHKTAYGFYTPAQSVGMGDLTIIARDWLGQEDQRWYPRLNQYCTRRHELDEEFEEVIGYAKDSILRDLNEEERESFPLEAYLDNALHLMRRGFNKAQRRWGAGFRGVDTYCAIRDAIEPHAKRSDIEGREFRLSYGNGRASCVEVYPEGIY